MLAVSPWLVGGVELAEDAPTELRAAVSVRSATVIHESVDDVESGDAARSTMVDGRYMELQMVVGGNGEA